MNDEIVSDLVIHQQYEIRVYANGLGGIVLLMDDYDKEECVVFNVEYADRIIAAIDRVRQQIAKGE